MSDIKTVGIVGAGVIGAGWAARSLARGYDIVAWDPGNGAGDILRAKIANAWPALVRIGWAKTPEPPAIDFTDDMEYLARKADFIQESAPERIDLKQTLHTDMDKYADSSTLLASSSSGLLPTEIQANCNYPERVLIGHPFNPVYLLPLCELVAGEKTSSFSVDRAEQFYKTLGMHPLRVRKEVEAYLSDRLQEAIWREALHLVNDGVATTSDLDAAIIYGPGLRWAFMGMFRTFHMAGGNQGMRHFMEQFGPALKLPWTKLEGPELTDELMARIIEDCDEGNDGKTIEEWEQLRDNCLIDIMRTLRTYNLASGRTLAEDEARDLSQNSKRWTPGDKIPAPLDFYHDTVKPAWVDYNGHMNESSYLEAAGWAADKMFRFVGIDEDYRAAGKSVYTVESHINYLREIGGGEPISITTQMLGVDDKRFHFFHTMYHGQTGDMLATIEQMYLHVDMNESRACPFEPRVKQALDAIAHAHAHLELPANAGRQMALKK